MLFVDGTQWKHDESTKSHATNIRITSITRQQKRFSTSNTKVKSKNNAALIARSDQGSIVLTFTLVLLVLKRFWWRVMLVILMFVACLLVYLLCFIAYHLRISCCLCAVTFQSYANSCCIKLVAWRQHSASFPSSRSNLFALILKSWRNIC